MTQKLFAIAPAIAILALVSHADVCGADTTYLQTNLTSDLPGVAAHLDPNLVNPWGIASLPTSPFWISDNGTGVATLYNGSGIPQPVTPQPLVVTIPPPGGATPPSAPTGAVANTTTDFGGARFIFATEDGTIAAWTSGTNAILQVDNSAAGAVYKGLAIGNNGSQNLIYAANFTSGHIDVFNGLFSPVTLPGAFTDPNLPAGFAPFDIQNIGGNLYVTYAKQAGKDDVPGPGNGFVNIFDTKGTLIRRLVSNGPLNSPWGLALAPAGFGTFGNDLLVGNFGDGTIHAFDPVTGALAGILSDLNGNPIVNEGLWGLAFGNGGPGFVPNSLYFTAGIQGSDAIEDHGLFGRIQALPEPGTFWLTGAGLIAGFAWMRRRRHVIQ
jgi:uncharacterized protein (TIGR03118 family)